MPVGNRGDIQQNCWTGIKRYQEKLFWTAIQINQKKVYDMGEEKIFVNVFCNLDSEWNKNLQNLHRS